MPLDLYHQGSHRCLMFADLCDTGGEAVQANQFLLLDGEAGAIIDPGGNLAYNELYLQLGRHLAPHKLSAIIASHADPDIIASLDRWTTATAAPIYISRIWERFIPHLCKPGKTAGRVVGIPDAGMRIPFGRGTLWALPAHFLHAEGNFQFYDPVSRILFSGDLGSSMVAGASVQQPAAELAPLLPSMTAFHQRYMAGNKVLRLWADMVAPLDIRMIAPQHGVPLVGAAVAQFIDWVRGLPCGIDLLGPAQYAIPRA